MLQIACIYFMLFVEIQMIINSSEYENQIIDRPFYQTVDSSAVSMKSALGRDRDALGYAERTRA